MPMSTRSSCAESVNHEGSATDIEKNAISLLASSVIALQVLSPQSGSRQERHELQNLRGSVRLASGAAYAEYSLTCCLAFSSLKGVLTMSSIFFRPRTLAKPCVETLSTRCRFPVVNSP